MVTKPSLAIVPLQAAKALANRLLHAAGKEDAEPFHKLLSDISDAAESADPASLAVAPVKSRHAVDPEVDEAPALPFCALPPEQSNLPRGRRDNAEQHADGRGFAAAVGPEKAEDLALLDLK